MSAPPPNSSTADWLLPANGNKRAGGHDDVLECWRVHKRWGEAPHAFVVLEAGATATETERRNYARDHLAYFKCPQKIRFVRKLLKTAIGQGPEVCPSRQARDFEAVTVRRQDNVKC